MLVLGGGGGAAMAVATVVVLLLRRPEKRGRIVNTDIDQGMSITKWAY